MQTKINLREVNIEKQTRLTSKAMGITVNVRKFYEDPFKVPLRISKYRDWLLENAGFTEVNKAGIIDSANKAIKLEAFIDQHVKQKSEEMAAAGLTKELEKRLPERLAEYKKYLISAVSLQRGLVQELGKIKSMSNKAKAEEVKKTDKVEKVA